ncbi:MAG: DUF937 domain-containing protein [Methanoregulaceae archaeon]|nr:MAG: DUF937 domain-containing protein [Methanoregulaceae archaeon]
MDIVAALMKQVATGDNLAMISKSVGGGGKAVQSALGMGLPMIMGSMATTAAAPGGADILTKMMTSGASSNPLDNLGGFLSNPAAAGGSAMVSTLLGGQMSGIQSAISQKTGLPPAIVSQVMAIAAPMVIGYVGKMFVSQKMDAKGLTSLLGDQSRMAMAASPEAAAMAKQFMGAAIPQSAGGVGGFLKKLFGKE